MNRIELLQKIKLKYGSVDKFAKTLFLDRSCVYRHISGYAHYRRIESVLVANDWVKKRVRFDRRYKKVKSKVKVTS